MQLYLPDIGDLLVALTLLFSALMVVVGLLENRKAEKRERRLLNAIDEEYRAFFQLGLL